MSHSEVDPFTRQRAVASIGAQGQSALETARVLVIGLGGLGCPAALYLAAAGVGTLTVVDPDHVTVTNLHRQILYGPDDVGSRKVDAATRALRRVAPWCAVEKHAIRFDGASDDLLDGHNIVLDCSDTWNSRHDIAAACERRNMPLVWGAVHEWHGQVALFRDEFRLSDVFPEPAEADLEACDGQGVVGAVCGAVGTAMALRAVAYITGQTPRAAAISVLDGRTGSWRDVPVRPMSAVPVRGPGA